MLRANLENMEGGPLHKTILLSQFINALPRETWNTLIKGENMPSKLQQQVVWPLASLEAQRSNEASMRVGCINQPASEPGRY